MRHQTINYFLGYTAKLNIGFRRLLSPITLPLLAAVACFGQTPLIFQAGIVPLNSTVSVVQPGEWVSIYGENLSTSVATWSGDFPTSLGGTSVTIDGRAAYLWYVSPGQINLQVPDDSYLGSVPVVVTTPSGVASATVTLSQFSPSFNLADAKHVSGIILRSDGSGAYGGGSYDILGPTGSSLGYPTVAAKPGDNVELYGVGFGPTSPPVPSGTEFTGAAPTTSEVTVLMNNSSVIPSFAGLSSAGLYQLNITIPAGAGPGDVPLQASVGGVQTQSGIVIPLQDASPGFSLTSFSQLSLGLTFSPTGYVTSEINLNVEPETGLKTFTLSEIELTFIHCVQSLNGTTYTCNTLGPSVNLLPVGTAGYSIVSISVTLNLGPPTYTDQYASQGPITGTLTASVSSSIFLTSPFTISGPLNGTYTLTP